MFQNAIKRKITIQLRNKKAIEMMLIFTFDKSMDHKYIATQLRTYNNTCLSIRISILSNAQDKPSLVIDTCLLLHH